MMLKIKNCLIVLPADHAESKGENGNEEGADEH